MGTQLISLNPSHQTQPTQFNSNNSNHSNQLSPSQSKLRKPNLTHPIQSSPTQLTQLDRHTRISELFGIGLPTYQKCLQKISERYLIQNWRYLYNFSKEVSQLTDLQTYKKFRIIWNQCRNILE